MNSKKNGKPISITVISTLLIFTAFIIALHALINFNLKPIAEIFEIMRTMELEVPVFLIILFSLNRQIFMIPALEIAFAFFVVLSAVEFLKLKSWARISLMLIAFIEIALFLGHLGFWAMMVNLLPDVTMILLGIRSSETLMNSLSIYTGALFLLLILPLIVSVIVLMTEKVRSMMSTK